MEPTKLGVKLLGASKEGCPECGALASDYGIVGYDAFVTSCLEHALELAAFVAKECQLEPNSIHGDKE